MIKKKSYWILMLTAICILAVTGCKKEGKTAQEILKKSQKPIGDYTDAINKARERLRKVGAIK